jgi:hypothetical protein
MEAATTLVAARYTSSKPVTTTNPPSTGNSGGERRKKEKCKKNDGRGRFGANYRILNGPPDPRPALALNGPALSGPTLYSPMAFLCRAESGVVSNWRPGTALWPIFRAGQHDDADDLMSRDRAVIRPDTIGQQHPSVPMAAERAPGGVGAISVVRRGRPVAVSATIDGSQCEAASLGGRTRTTHPRWLPRLRRSVPVEPARAAPLSVACTPCDQLR